MRKIVHTDGRYRIVSYTEFSMKSYRPKSTYFIEYQVYKTFWTRKPVWEFLGDDVFNGFYYIIRPHELPTKKAALEYIKFHKKERNS